MDFTINTPEKAQALNAILYTGAAEFEKETKQAEELSCSLQLKNLLLTNLRLLKLNEITAILLF